jgi:hypothetical protein
MSFPQLVIDLIMGIPFLASGCAIVMAIRGVVKGKLRSSSRFGLMRTLHRSANANQFWIEIGLYCVSAIFLLLMGLMFFEHAPNWFYELMLHKSKRT